MTTKSSSSHDPKTLCIQERCSDLQDCPGQCVHCLRWFCQLLLTIMTSSAIASFYLMHGPLGFDVVDVRICFSLMYHDLTKP